MIKVQVKVRVELLLKCPHLVVGLFGGATCAHSHFPLSSDLSAPRSSPVALSQLTGAYFPPFGPARSRGASQSWSGGPVANSITATLHHQQDQRIPEDGNTVLGPRTDQAPCLQLWVNEVGIPDLEPRLCQEREGSLDLVLSGNNPECIKTGDYHPDREPPVPPGESQPFSWSLDTDLATRHSSLE